MCLDEHTRSAEPKVKHRKRSGCAAAADAAAADPRLRCRTAGARKRPRKSASDANAALRSAPDERAKLPSKIELKKLLKHETSALALGRAKQVRYTAGDAAAIFASYRSNFLLG